MLLFVLLFGVAYIVCTALFTTPVQWVFTQVGLRYRVENLLTLIAALVATVVMIHAVDKRSWRDLGLGQQSASPSAFAQGLALGAVAIGVTCGLLYLLGWLRIVPNVAGSSLAAGLRLSGFLLVAAMSEELLCRGYLLSVTRDALGTRGAVVATSALFGLLHTFNPGATTESVLLVMLAGLFLAAVRVAFDSLYAAWATHTAWNWVMAVPLHAKVSGFQFEAPDYRAITVGPAWISGGAWGPEGGAAAALGMIAALVYLYYARRRREES